MNKRATGTSKEYEAAEYLKRCGLKIIERNFSCRFGEIDIIASDGDYTVFIEVKYRKTASSGHPEEAVDLRKARKISKVSDYYRMIRHLGADAMIRYDVVAIEGRDIKWYKNAFEYIS